MPETRLRLAAKARLRYDRFSRRYFLLSPERGLDLNQTAEEIVRLCDGEHTVSMIIRAMASRYRATATKTMELEIHAFLVALMQRRLVVAT